MQRQTKLRSKNKSESKDPPPTRAQHALSVHFQREHKVLCLFHATNHENSGVNTVNKRTEWMERKKKKAGVDLVFNY